jgi:hypothetical protein
MSESGATIGGDWPEVKRLLAWGESHVPITTARGLRRGIAILEGHVRRALSGEILNRKTSTLVRSVGTREEDGGLKQFVGAGTFYAATHEGQVRPELIDGDFVVIKPVKAQYLSFSMQTGNKLVRAKSGALKPGAAVNTFVRVKQVRIPIRRPFGTVYDQHGREAMEEVQRVIYAALSPGGDRS